MTETTVQYTVNCKRCGTPIGYSGMMYERMKEYGHSRPEYCESCRVALTMEKTTMGAAYFSVRMLPGIDRSIVVPGELGKVWHPDRPHVKSVEPKKFDASKFGATPDKVVEIYEWLKDPRHQVVIVKGGTGSGKSTALPYWLVYPPEGVPSDFFIRDGQILITQPRILATTGVSKYLGTLMGSTVGKGFDIGYRYSKDRNADRFNAAFMATDGTLINMIKKGELADLSVVMIDEAHERSLNIDIILHLMREMLPLYPHLKLLIVSATINAESFLNYFGKETATLVEFEPKSKFIYVGHFADESEKINYENMNELRKQLVPALVKKVVWLLKEQAEGRKGYGHVLAFLQGVKPIEEAVRAIRLAVAADPLLKNMVEVLPLYSTLPEEESDYAINTIEPSKIRVIVSTNVAEASITVEGVIYVIESGVENQSQWEVEETKQTVELRRISKANAKQRFGRSGRTRNGEVFTLYTEAQFDQMLDFPVPAIQRSSMEEIILKLKELGIDDYAGGWIDAPQAEELARSVSLLKSSGAIDDDNMLTEYGALLSQFQYPATLADLVILADRFGCAVEIATLLPIIKSGGYRSFLKRETSWDEPTKQKVEKIQNVLWSGCKDDVEFIFRMFSFWQDPPDVGETNDGERKSLKERRDAFADAFYVDFDIFEEDIEPERGRVLRLLSGHRKDKNTRSLQFDLLERVRTILAFCVPFETVAEGDYSFNSRPETKTGEAAAYQLCISTERAEKISQLKAENASYLKLATESNRWEEEAEPLDSVLARLLAKPVLPSVDTKAFEDFVAKFKIGDELVVEATGYAEHAGDYRVSLVVKEKETGYETWLTPNDLNFTSSAAVIKQIPIGTKLKVMVKEIVPDKSFVRLYCLPLIEAELETAYRSLSKVDGQVVTRAQIIDVRTDGKIVFVAELSRPSEGFILVIHAVEKVLSKPLQEYKVGDNCLVRFRLDTGNDFKADLAEVTPKLSEYLKQTDSKLCWAEGKLKFRGRMKYAELLELVKIDTDSTSLLGALDHLYLASNMNWASRVDDADWLESANKKYISGTTVEVTVDRVISAGLLVSLADGQAGFIHTNGPVEVKEGEKVKAKISGLNEGRQQVLLSLVLAAINPLVQFAKGKVVTGVVDNVVEYGAFVKLGQGYSGLIFMPKARRPADFPDKGSKVEVEILDIKEEKGRLKISLGLRSVIS